MAHEKALDSNSCITFPASGSGPGVLVLHSWWGLNPFFRSVCQRLSDVGFVALAPDLYNGRTASTISTARALRKDAMAKRKEPAYKYLQRNIEHLISHDAVLGKDIGVMGFSMGGHWAFWLAQRPHLPISATVTFYSSRNGDYSRSNSAFLCHFADDDDYVSAVSRKRIVNSLRQYRISATMHDYPHTRHWFFEEDQPEYFDQPAASLAWDRSVHFLHEQLQID
ncbi:MAG: dienelactone hydrolase family protein [Rhodothermales bacterium]|nr:dienelactone hydrolase family protein [Rhodothermales bacterium]